MWWLLCRLYLCTVCVMPQMPLFTNVDDLMTSWERLKTEAGSEAKSPTIQVGAECRSFVLTFTPRPSFRGCFLSWPLLHTECNHCHTAVLFLFWSPRQAKLHSDMSHQQAYRSACVEGERWKMSYVHVLYRHSA